MDNLLATYSMTVDGKHYGKLVKNLVNTAGTIYLDMSKAKESTSAVAVQKLTTHMGFTIPKLLGEYSSIAIGITLESVVPEGMSNESVTEAHQAEAVDLLKVSYNEIAKSLNINPIFPE